MIKLALVGKNIQHSMSPALYRKLLGEKAGLEYQLLDYPNETDIPLLPHIFEKYRLNGLSVTAPYKKVFLDQLKNGRDFVNRPINTIKKDGESFLATNTDELATEEILKSYKTTLSNPYVVLLGSGSMAQITIPLLKNLGFDFSVLSRRDTENFEHLNVEALIEDQKRKTLIINACSRDYRFRGKLNNKMIFWDYNYNIPDQNDFISKAGAKYIDGLELLEKQAIHALKFWQINY